MDLIRKALQFRELIGALTRKEIRKKFEGSALGWPWPFLQQFLSLAVYWFVFMKILTIKLDMKFAEVLFPEDPSLADKYQVLLICCGILPWQMTSEYISRSLTMVLANRNLVKKVYFPAELLPLPPLLAQLTVLSVVFVLVILITFIFTPFGSSLLWMLPLVMFLHAIFLLGICYTLSTITVFFRDLEQIVPLILHLTFFLTPIVYVREVLAASGNRGLTWVFDLNPLAYCVDLYRFAVAIPSDKRFTAGEMPAPPGVDTSAADYVPALQPILIPISKVWVNLGIFAAVSFATFFIGYKIFMSQKHKFADEI